MTVGAKILRLDISNFRETRDRKKQYHQYHLYMFLSKQASLRSSKNAGCIAPILEILIG